MQTKVNKTYVTRIIISVSAFVMLLFIALPVYAQSWKIEDDFVLPDEYTPQGFKRDKYGSNTKDFIIQSVDPGGKEESYNLRYVIYGPFIYIPKENVENFSANPNDPDTIFPHLSGRDMIFSEVQIGQWLVYLSNDINPSQDHYYVDAACNIGTAAIWLSLHAKQAGYFAPNYIAVPCPTEAEIFQVVEQLLNGCARYLSDQGLMDLNSSGIAIDPGNQLMPDSTTPGAIDPDNPFGPTLTGPGSDSPIPDVDLLLATGGAALVTALSALGLAYSGGTTPAEAFGELKALFTPNREEAQLPPQDQPVDGRDPQEILRNPRFHDQITDVDGKKWVYYRRPGDTAGDGWTSAEEYSQTLTQEREGKIWTDRYGWQTRAGLANSEQMAEKFAAGNRESTAKFNAEIKEEVRQEVESKRLARETSQENIVGELNKLIYESFITNNAPNTKARDEMKKILDANLTTKLENGNYVASRDKIRRDLGAYLQDARKADKSAFSCDELDVDFHDREEAVRERNTLRNLAQKAGEATVNKLEALQPLYDLKGIVDDGDLNLSPAAKKLLNDWTKTPEKQKALEKPAKIIKIIDNVNDTWVYVDVYQGKGYTLQGAIYRAIERKAVELAIEKAVDSVPILKAADAYLSKGGELLVGKDLGPKKLVTHITQRVVNYAHGEYTTTMPTVDVAAPEFQQKVYDSNVAALKNLIKNASSEKDRQAYKTVLQDLKRR
jgi:hypothetical protein